MVDDEDGIETDKGRVKINDAPHSPEKRWATLAGKAGHQLDTDLDASLLQYLYSPATVRGCMATSGFLQNIIIQGLDTHLDNRHPSLAQEPADIRVKTIGPSGKTDALHITAMEKRPYDPKHLFLLLFRQAGK